MSLPSITTALLPNPADQRPIRNRNLTGIVLLVFLLVVITCLMFTWLVILPHVQAAGYFLVGGHDAHWSASRSNWYKGGKTEVSFVRDRRGWSDSVQDQDLEMLGRLHRVESVDISAGIQITDEGMFAIARLPHLKVLQLGKRLQGTWMVGANLTEKGIAELTKLKELQTLSLDGHRLSKESIRLIGTMNLLVTLDLSDTPITDADLDLLANLTELKTLYIEQNQITPQAVAKLRLRLPGLTTIDYGTTRNRSTGTLNN